MVDAEFVPTTDDVRGCYGWADSTRRAERYAEFDRWLEAHDTEVRNRGNSEEYEYRAVGDYYVYESLGKLREHFPSTWGVERRVVVGQWEKEQQ